MMFKRISLIASLLFFLLGTNTIANLNYETPAQNNGKYITQSHTLVKNVSKTSSGNTMMANSQTKEIKTAEPTLKDYVVPAIVGLFIFFGFGSYWLIFRRKYNSR